MDITIYKCDPDKNERCGKMGCYLFGGPCTQTTHAECAATDGKGNLIFSEKKAVRNVAGSRAVHVFCSECDHHYDYNGSYYCRRWGDKVVTEGGYCYHGIHS